MSLDNEFIELQEQVEAISKTGEKGIAKNCKIALIALGVLMAKLYEKHEIEGQLTFIEMAKYDRLQRLDKEVYTLVTELYKDNNGVIKGALKGVVEHSYSKTLSITQSATDKRLKGTQSPMDVTKTINMEMAGLKWTNRMNYHRSTAVYEIQKEIKTGLTQSDTYGTMAKRLKKKLEVDIQKANQIIRTESHRCNAQAKKDSLDSIAKQGIRMTKKWVSSQDERVRSQHDTMNGVEIPYEDDFVMPDGVRGPSPGLIGQPQHDINCRCIQTIDIVTDENSKGLSSNGGTSEPDESIFVEKLDKVDYDIAKEKLIGYEKEIVNKDFENAYAITEDGEVYRFEGQQSTVNPSRLGNELKDSYVTHNHPKAETEYTFSEDDLHFFENYKLNYLRGIDDKYIYEMSRGLFDSDTPVELTLSALTEENYHHMAFIEKAKSKGISYRRRKHGQ